MRLNENKHDYKNFETVSDLGLLRLFSVALLGRFCCANEAASLEADEQKKEKPIVKEQYK